MDFWKLVENGEIPTRVSPNDTKINNILFDKRGEVLCVIDADTVLSQHCSERFSDAIEYYTNTGKEDDTNLENVSMSMEIFTAFAKGYLEEAASFLTDKEIEYLAFSAGYITFEQVLRFLMDYIDGGKIIQNKICRSQSDSHARQYKLLTSIEGQYQEMKKVIGRSHSKTDKSEPDGFSIHRLS